MTLDLSWWQFAAMVVDYAIKFVMIGVVPGGRKPSSANAWLLLILLLPVVGLPLYLLFGSTFVSRRRHRIQVRARRALDGAWAGPDDTVRHLPPETASLLAHACSFVAPRSAISRAASR